MPGPSPCLETPLLRYLDEYPSVHGGRLGRHIEHDPRSRAYALSEDLLPAAFATVEHTIRIPVLDQGALGSCTGNAAESLLGSDPLYDAIPAAMAARPTGDADVDERQAVALYAAATHLDGIHGQYPPTDTGSTGLAVARAAQKAGLISGYQHALNLDATLRALTATPVIVGVNWYEGFDTPDNTGLVRISGSVRGGHEFLLYGIDATARTVLARNSWGTGWGAAGCFSFSFDDLGRLLDEQGDATVFVPLTSPAPAPVPTPASVDQALAVAARAWLTTKGL
ncbi:hypothetical protein [Streptomyces abikoensis]|uniref:Peptidase C1A papain C-terminal domain-containing protein n=1 Tax=Streptomyces abikoensis TaxID=97398 RepID=A0ABW7TDL1_9ACTN